MQVHTEYNMNITNKKIFIGCVIALIIGLNIYNIPSKVDAKTPVTSAPVETDIHTVDINKLQKAFNAQLEKPVNLKQYSTVIATFWATWCPSCRKENAIFNTFVKKESDVLIVGICMDKDPNALGAYIKKTPLNFTIVNNTKPIAQQFTDIFAVPTHFIINTKTGVATKTMGLISLSDLEEYSQRNQ